MCTEKAGPEIPAMLNTDCHLEQVAPNVAEGPMGSLPPSLTGTTVSLDAAVD